MCVVRLADELVAFSLGGYFLDPFGAFLGVLSVAVVLSVPVLVVVVVVVNVSGGGKGFIQSVVALADHAFHLCEFARLLLFPHSYGCVFRRRIYR